MKLTGPAAMLLAALEATEEHHDEVVARYESTIASHKNDVEYWRQAVNYHVKRRDESTRFHEEQMREKNARVAQLGEEAAVLKEKVNTANATRDLVIRMVNQFTSLQITPLGTTLQTMNHENTPAPLRRG